MSAAPSPRLRFGQKSRLKHKRDFLGVRQRGTRLACGCLVGNWEQRPSGAASRLGVVTSGKLGKAVVRTRARRLLRETFRLHQHALAHPVDLVLVARPSIVGKEFAQVDRDYLTMLRKTGLMR